MIWIAYTAGVFTIPVAAILYWLFFEATSTAHGLECVAGDLKIDTRQMTRIKLWFVWRWHRATVGRQAWHREKVVAYQRRWSLPASG